MNRRNFLSFLASLPIVGRLIPANKPIYPDFNPQIHLVNVKPELVAEIESRLYAHGFTGEVLVDHDCQYIITRIEC